MFQSLSQWWSGRTERQTQRTLRRIARQRAARHTGSAYLSSLESVQTAWL